MSRRKNRPVRNLKKTVGIVVDGKTEHWYFILLKRLETENLRRVKINPTLPKKTRLEDQFKLVEEMVSTYDIVFWIIDLDVVLKENKEKKANKPFNVLQKYIITSRKLYPNLKICVNTPCLEFWYLLHFENTQKFYRQCDKVTRALKKHLPDYEKTKRFYLQRNPELYEVLRPNLSTALERASNLPPFDIANPAKPQAGIHEVLLWLKLK